MGKKRRLHQSKHPFNAYPFEAYDRGSWKAVEFIKVEAGVMVIHFVDKHRMSMDKGPSGDIRVRSRKATTSDCSCILRSGLDVCVELPSKKTDGSDESGQEPVWADARISSIQRKPHDSECSCQFYVNFYVNQGSLGAEIRTLKKEIKVVGINQISILQRLEHFHCEDQHYRWASTEDCSTLPQTRLLVGKFLPDLSWMIVTSVLKKVSFCVRSLENKLVYQVLGSGGVVPPLNTKSHINVVNFKVEENEMVVPFVSEVVDTSNTETNDVAHECHEEEALGSYNVEGLRRSKRRHVQPERYLGCDNSSEINVGTIRTRPPYKMGTLGGGEEENKDDDELSLPLARLFRLQKNCPKQSADSTEKVNKTDGSPEIIVYNRRAKKPEDVKSGDVVKKEHLNPLAIIPPPIQGDPVSIEKQHNLNDKIARSSGHESGEIPSRYHHLINNPKLKRSSINLINFEPHNLPVKSDDAEKGDGFSSRCHYIYGAPKSQKKSPYDMYDMDIGPNKWEGIQSKKGAQDKKYRSAFLRSKNPGEERTYKDRTLNAAAYKELINSYLKNINAKPTNEEPAVTDQWKQFQDTRSVGQTSETEIPHGEDEEETSELNMLWREMEVSLASTYLEEAEASNADDVAEASEKPKLVCDHYYRLDDEIGICCLKCGHVETDIKAITPPFIQHHVWHQEEKQSGGDGPEPKADEDEDFKLVSNLASPDEPISLETDNVWALIPELGKKLHIHQKKAFEFLWKNIAGSMEPALMESKSRKRGGCVISHTPGAGKTFLIIAFLVSYLKLFPGKRPLVLAPKTTLYTWYKEFIKWEIPIPVYLVHGRRTYRVFNQNTTMHFPGMPKPTEDVKHVIDCLEKIQKWHSHPSVLIMGYTSFLTLMREDSKYAHRKYMSKVLRESPGLLVLDEGHNPRSTKSRLRKVLMKVHTELRILLSGTLFQNNFCEYFNTLCLARPKFPQEVLKALDPKYKRKKKGKEKALESRARKFFLENIAKKIDSNVGEERLQGLNMLRNLTNGFIDNYEAGGSDGLPGLQIYTLLMNSTDMQHDILSRLHKKMAKCNGYPLELELLITLGSIHPWLVKTAVCANKFFTMAELMELDKCKFDLKIGSKVRFVLSLIYRVVQKEKVLIFCHNIAPVKLFLEYFEKYFKWQRGREVLVLTGELELFERGRVMDKFEEPGGASKILLASITACAEGISLTAASRVIMLDSEWNPSKTKQAIARAFRPGQQKMVYVYQLLVTGSLEEDKYRRTTWKEWVSSMIFSEEFVEDPSQWQAEKIEDDILREMVAEDKSKSFHMIMKNEKASTQMKAS